ncbi:MAG: hypothetical protein JWN56_1545 [Sphingobacteriales bacterium]|nr:hypothetical protein [Sphingobacteriales bacterium]
MKKLIFLLVFVFTMSNLVNAQDSKDKVKPTSTIPQKVHNTVSKNKKHNGYKTKKEHGGIIKKRKVNTQTGKVIKKTKTE